ncbi:NAD-dependent epimerase/dehydratase family protein [Cryptosporangium arvum]|uniref:UDP-glucose 4-epimerase n=1 Tax=Cryptosporangium arvum DSM 44712 TaxID=927661 RepID=A0A010YMX8_9ACTN|nr:NAD-dependent epimerase/dehydratase family protein [Cryptosporangium arvum]EXG81565.1 UDP-glucose 4-epimerase [Cryptosporangium arvum DSM 44712]
MRVLVTGGAGFIGSHVVESLARAGHHPVVVDSLAPDLHPAGAPAVLDGHEIVRADVRDADAMSAVVRGVDAVVHQAARVGLGVNVADLPAYVADNDLGTAVVLASAAEHGVRRLVLASSMVVYGEGSYRCARHGTTSPGPRAAADLSAGRFEPTCPRCGQTLEPGLVDEDTRLDPRSVYAATKVAQEHLAAAWARDTGARVVALRYHNVYGPRMPRDTPYAGVASLFRSALERGEAPRVFEDGAQRRDFVHVTDVAAANVAALRALSTLADGSLLPCNVASGEPRSIGEMARTLAAAFGGPAPVVTGDYRLGDVRHVVASPARAAARLGFVAAVPFTDGVTHFARAPLRG